MNIYTFISNYFTPSILKFIIAVFVFIVFDTISGLTTAWKNKNINSNKLRGGVDKFVKYSIFIGIGIMLDLLFNFDFICVSFCSVLIAIELKSLDENLKLIGVNIPQFVFDLFKHEKDIDNIEK